MTKYGYMIRIYQSLFFNSSGHFVDIFLQIKQTTNKSNKQIEKVLVAHGLSTPYLPNELDNTGMEVDLVQTRPGAVIIRFNNCTKVSDGIKTNLSQSQDILPINALLRFTKFKILLATSHNLTLVLPFNDSSLRRLQEWRLVCFVFYCVVFILKLKLFLSDKYKLPWLLFHYQLELNLGLLK